MNPGFIFTSASAHLGDDHQTVWIGMERLLDDLIRDVRTVEVAGVDVVDPQRDSLSQYRDCNVNIARRPPTCGPASCIAPYPMRFTVIEVPGRVKLPPAFI
jgi:hypothetical protein